MGYDKLLYHEWCLGTFRILIKRQRNPFTGLGRPWGFQEVGTPRFQDNRHMKSGKVVSPTHRSPLPRQEIFLVLRLSRPQRHSAAGRIMPKKNSNDTIGIRTRHLPACSIMPQPTAPTRAPRILKTHYILKLEWNVCTCLTQLYLVVYIYIYRIYYIKINYMFRPLAMAIFRLRLKNLVSSYTRLM